MIRAAAALALVAAAAASRGLSAVRPGGCAAPGDLVDSPTALLGGFRGLYADLLWYRAEERLLRSPAVLHDLPALYERIGRLQPHYPGMWYYTASRMAFDAPAKILFPTPEGDWVWARRGIEQLEEGIRLNEGHPDCGRLRYGLAEIYHRRCTPRPANTLARYGTHAWRRLKEVRGEEAYDRVVALAHQYREDPETLPSWIAKAAHAETEAAVLASTPAEEDRRLAAAEEEWRWLVRLYVSPSPANRWVRENAQRYRVQAGEIESRDLEALARKRRALGLEEAQRVPEAEAAWTGLLREHLLNTGRADLLARKHLRRLARYAEALEALARELGETPVADPSIRERKDALVRLLREQAVLEREGKGDA